MFYDDDERPSTGRRREEEGEGRLGTPTSRPSTASRDARASRANQLATKRKERSSIGMVVASDNMPRPSTAVGSRPSTPDTGRTSSTSNLLPPSLSLTDSPTSPPSPLLPSSRALPHDSSFSSSPVPISPPTPGDYPRPPTAMHEEKTLTDSEKELLKRGISPTFDPNVDKPIKPALDFTDIRTFTMRPPPKGGMVQCRIVREKGGLMHPHYHLFLEENGCFLLSARKRKKSKSANYLISLDKTDMARDGPNYMGKLRSNFVGTEFVIYDKGLSLKENKEKGQTPDPATLRQELAAVCYGSNVLGMKGPRKMTVLIPALKDNSTRVTWKPTSNTETLVSHYNNNNMANMVVLQNKAPQWNEETRSYVLNFHNRVKQASVKNFQLVHPDDPDYLILQFGRVSEDVFTMDFQYPMCMLQAFAIALSSFDNKLACE